MVKQLEACKTGGTIVLGQIYAAEKGARASNFYK
jgi:hypothetical protein